MIDPGDKLRIHYPECNHVGFVSDLRARLIDVRRVRDLVADPMSIEEFLRRPYVRRSRWLATGVDEETGRWRQFYLGSSDEYRSPGLLRLGLYEPESQRPYRVLGRPYLPTREDRRRLAKLLLRLSQQPPGELQYRIYADDLRAVAG